MQSLDSGFSRALATIVDANFTTFIAAIILFYLGSGPVKGFAVTLAIGIVTTVFTAFTLTRWLVAVWLKRAKPKELLKGLFRLVPDDTKIPFMSWRKYAFTLSAAASIASMVLFFSMEMNWHRLAAVRASKSRPRPTLPIPATYVPVNELNVGDVQVQEFGSPRDLLIRIEGQGGGDNAEQSAVQKVRIELENDYDFRKVESVGPTVSNELAKNGVIGVVASLIAMLIYIWFRFEWQFGLGAVIATVHDVTMMIGLYVVTGLEFNLTSIASSSQL